jgi:hypothetical protein
MVISSTMSHLLRALGGLKNLLCQATFHLVLRMGDLILLAVRVRSVQSVFLDTRKLTCRSASEARLIARRPGNERIRLVALLRGEGSESDQVLVGSAACLSIVGFSHSSPTQLRPTRSYAFIPSIILLHHSGSRTTPVKERTVYLGHDANGQRKRGPIPPFIHRIISAIIT